MLTKEIINDKIKNQGCIPLAYEFIGWQTIVNFLDKDGYKYSTSWNNFKKSKKLQIVGQSNPYSVENARLYLQLNNMNVVLLSHKINNVQELLKFQCTNCNGYFESSWNNIKSRKTFLCNQCIKDLNITGKRGRVGNDVIQKCYEKNGLSIINKNKSYLTNDNIDCYDEQGYKYSIRYSNLKSGKSFVAVSAQNPYAIYNLQLYLNKTGSKTKVISTTFKHRKSFLLFKCGECEQLFKRKWNDMVADKSYFCRNCSYKTSRLERAIMQYLDKHSIKYESEKRFSNCKNIRALPFDFYIPSKNLIIEADGQQHYYPCNFNGCSNIEAIKSFNSTQKNDRIKNEYCKLNNITLVRLPYWQFENDEYIKILDKLIND